AILIGIAVLLIGIAIPVWLLTGHHTMTNFQETSGWMIHWGSQGSNINLFGLITLAYLGTEVPLNMGSELTKKQKASRHILWGTLLTLVGYFIATLALLIIRGNSVSPFDMVTLVNMTLGKFAGAITVIAMITFALMVPIIYNCTFA